MKRVLALFMVLGLALTFFIVGVQPAAAEHNLGPCNDADGDGSPSGREYAQHHIVPLAKAGGMGEGGHKPGSHHGFSICT